MASMILVNGDRLPGGIVYTYFSILTLWSLKNHWGKGRRPKIFIFVVWSVLIADKWVMVTWCRKFSLGPSEIASFVCLVLLRDEVRRMSPIFHLFVSHVNHWNEEAGWVQGSRVWPRDSRRMTERLYLDLPWTAKSRVCILEVGCGGVPRSWLRGICNRRLI